MRKKLIFIACAVITFFGGMLTMSPAAADNRAAGLKKPDPVRDKARYYYLEGLRRQVDGHGDEAYEYYRKAYNLDKSYDEAASAFGQQRLSLQLDTMRTPAELNRSAGMLRPFVDKYPGDYNEAAFYAFVAAQLDSLPEAIRVYERIEKLDPSKTGTLILLADAYYSLGRDSDAMAALNKYERAEGKSPQLTLKKIGYLINRRDTLGAIREGESLMHSNMREPSYRLMMGNLYALTNQKDSTFKYYSEAEAIAPDYGPAKLALADYYLNEGDSAKYDAKTYEALLSEDFDIEEKTAVLEQYLQTLINDKQNTERGDHLFNVVSGQYPHEPMVLDLAARYSAAKGDFDAAIENIDFAIGLSPTDVRLWKQKMQYQTADDKPDDALKTYRESARYIPDGDPDLTLLAAYSAQIAGRNDEAAEYFKKIVKDTAPNFPLGVKLTPQMVPSDISYEDLQKISAMLCAMADCFYNEKKTDEAFTEYENALLLNPENTLAMNNYAYFMSQSGGDLNRAEELSRKSLLGENADNPTFLDTYAWILYKLGKYDEAHKYQASAMEKAAETGSESADMYEHFGDILMAQGDKAGAVENWKKALALDPDNKEEIQKKIEDSKRK